MAIFNDGYISYNDIRVLITNRLFIEISFLPSSWHGTASDYKRDGVGLISFRGNLFSFARSGYKTKRGVEFRHIQ